MQGIKNYVQDPEMQSPFKKMSTRRQLMMFSSKIKDSLTESPNITEDVLMRIKQYLSNRWRIRITLRDILKFTFSKLFCCCCSRNGRNMDNIEKRKISLYKKGEQMILKELDCINIMTKLRQLDLLLSLSLSSKQKFLLHFQRKNLIKEDDSDSSSDEDKDGITFVNKFDEGNEDNQE